jgi:hypothetical protein
MMSHISISNPNLNKNNDDDFLYYLNAVVVFPNFTQGTFFSTNCTIMPLVESVTETTLDR